MRYDIAQHNEARKIKLPATEVVALYEAGKTIAEIASHHGVSVQPIKRILREEGVQMRRAAPRHGRLTGENNPAWRGGRRTRGDGYVLVWTPHGDRLEHRVVMERHLGRELEEGEVVHHKDGNPSNNHIDNLELFGSQIKHARHHGAENRETLLKHGLKACTLCGLVKELSEFYSTKHNKMGVQSWCKRCKNKRDSERRRRKSAR